jgi:hypothetical protein
MAAGVLGCAAPSWQPVQTNLPGALLSVWGTSDHDVYVVGTDARDGTGPLVLRYDGHWRHVPTGLTSGDLWWVYGVAPNAVYMVGAAGLILRYDPQAATFTRAQTPGTPTLYGVWGATPSDLWAVGGYAMPATGQGTAVLWHFDGNAWTDATTALPPAVAQSVSLFKVWGSSAADVWIVGTGGTAAHFDGSAWAAVPTGVTNRIVTVHGAHGMRIAVGGFGTALVLEGQGGGWAAASVANQPQMNGVFVPATGDPVAVGIAGAVLWRRANSWVPDPAAPDTGGLDFHAVWVDPGGGVWAVGGQIVDAPASSGIIWHFGTAAPRGAIAAM